MESSPHAPLTRSEEAVNWLKEQRGHFDHLVATVEDYAIFMLGLDGTILDWNAGAARLNGYTAAEIVGDHFSRFYSQEDLSRHLPELELVTAFEKGKFTDEGWRFRKDGSRFWAAVTITAIRAANGEIAGFLKITRDLTERKLAEESLRESEERFRLLIESVQDYAIFMLDPEGHVVTWNNGAHRIKQYEDHEIIGSHFSVFYPLEDRSINLPGALLLDALRDGRVEDEGWRVRKDGTRFLANVIITPLYSEKRELRGFTKITRDLTDQRQIEQLRESGRRKDAFLATLAHELRNPLAPILNAVDLIANNQDNRELVRELGEIMKTQVGQMTHLIDDLLDMARITSGKINLRKSVVGLAEVIETALQAVRPAIVQRHHEFVLEIPSRPVEVHADPHRLTQLITNLLSNAAKYTPEHGKLTLVVEQDDPEHVSIRVKDNGIGIPLVLQSSIFELFDQGTSGSADGLGIGLTLVKTLAELHGGTISVFSEGEGLGSEFTLRLPALDRSERDSTAFAEPVPASSHAFRILVADDSRNAADILAMFLRMEGYEVAIAYDGEEAIQKAGIFSPKLAFLDLGMPRINGLEAARALRQRFPDIVLIALSGWGEEADRRRTAEAGFDLHLVKPSKPEDIREVLARFAAKDPACT
ncbi:MAG: PAS domain S-box protein [Verrucomicrobiaceae bacterium]|nr:MAG: PAS domain S-box protein [Verrucomicrobiaceae bacterium]